MKKYYLPTFMSAYRITAMNISPEILRLIEDIRNNKTHGASELARQAVDVMKTAAELSKVNNIEGLLSEQRLVGEQLMMARLAMAPVYNIVNRLLDIISREINDLSINSAKRLIISKVEKQIDDSIKSVSMIAGYAAGLISTGDRVMTHSYSSTIVAAFRNAFTERGDIFVITTRSEPGRNGERIARQLGAKGIPLIFIDDSEVELFISQTDTVMVGADRICVDGSLINGIGTYQVALAAKKSNVPFYVLCEKLKFDPRLKGNEVDLEERESTEFDGKGELASEVTIRKPSFDVTPPELISGVVTEDGMYTSEEVINYINTLVA